MKPKIQVTAIVREGTDIDCGFIVTVSKLK